MNQKKKTITGSKKYFPTLIINQHIRLIFDTKDWRNDWWKFSFASQK